MSISLANAKIQVARSLGGQNDPDELRAAGDAINEAISIWNRANVWDYCRLDNLSDFTVASKTTNASATVTLPTGVTAPDFSNVYVGTKVSGTGIPAGTTVSAKASNSSLTLSANATASNDPVTLTFSGPIPIIAGQSDYILPYRFRQESYARLVTADTTLQYSRSRFVNQLGDPTIDMGMWGYGIMANQGAPDANNILPLPTSRLRIYSTPQSADTLVLEYFRYIQSFLNDLSSPDEARLLDVPDEFVYAILDMAEYVYMANKDSEIVRTGDRKQSAYKSLQDAIRSDSGHADDMVRFVPQVEWDHTGSTWRREWWWTI